MKATSDNLKLDWPEDFRIEPIGYDLTNDPIENVLSNDPIENDQTENGLEDDSQQINSQHPAQNNLQETWNQNVNQQQQQKQQQQQQQQQKQHTQETNKSTNSVSISSKTLFYQPNPVHLSFIQNEDGNCEFRLENPILKLIQEVESPQECPQPDEDRASPEKTFGCSHCQMRFSSTASRKAHARKVHKRELSCQPTFGSVQHVDLTTHEDVEEVKEYKCKTCGKEFMLEKNLRLHSKLHLGQKDYACSICDRSYFTKSGLQAHQRQMHSSDEARFFTCDVCELNLPTRYDLVRMLTQY
jgi:hypothetical protein